MYYLAVSRTARTAVGSQERSSRISLRSRRHTAQVRACIQPVRRDVKDASRFTTVRGPNEVALKLFGVLAAAQLSLLSVPGHSLAVPDAGDLINTIEEEVLPSVQEKLAAVTDSEEAKAVQDEIDVVEKELTSLVEEEKGDKPDSVLASAAQGISEQLNSLLDILGFD